MRGMTELFDGLFRVIVIPWLQNGCPAPFVVLDLLSFKQYFIVSGLSTKLNTGISGSAKPFSSLNLIVKFTLNRFRPIASSWPEQESANSQKHGFRFHQV